MKRYIRTNSNISGTILYRSGSTDPNIIANSTKGVFFVTDPEYFNDHPYMDFDEQYKQYLLLPSARVWEPEKEFEVFEINNWDYISCLLSDLEKFGLYDECDWEIEDGYGVTSTDGLAIAGKKLGYDAMAIHHIYYHHGYFDEYVVYNPAVLRELDEY